MNKKIDVKMLVLKRWNQTRTGKLFDENIEQRGQYISFQSYHFIDVYSVKGEPTLLQAYEQLQSDKTSKVVGMKEEANTRRDIFRDIHTVQSITLLGEAGSFWESSTDVMNITFIQQTDSTSWWYDDVKKCISNMIANKSKDNCCWHSVKWALYYSLDFCDLVLFTKNLKLSQLNEMLWEILLFQHEKRLMFRDTFTITCFEHTFLKNSFQTISDSNSKDDEPLGWDDKLALSINLSVWDFSIIPKLLESIIKIGGLVSESRLLGRYDFRITTEELHGSQILRILYQIDALFENQDNKQKESLNGYDVVSLVAAPEDNAYPAPKVPFKSTAYEEAVAGTLTKLYILFLEQDFPFTEYVKETLRALYELHNSGFSEEFVLSVLPSLSTFVEIEQEAVSFLGEAKKDSEKDPQKESVVEQIQVSLLHMQKNYFNALNTLALCTMHSERQFIHAPAFNATYFEIPPKILAFYNAITDYIASLLAEEEDKKYYFIIAPDYRSDLYVRPLNITYSRDTKKHLAIINLPEKYFYQPKEAIMLLAHEVGHYEGRRSREKRAENIFEMTGLLLLRSTPLVDCEHTVRLFAKEFGAFLYDQYHRQHKNRYVRGIEAQLDDVAQFLSEVHHGVDYLRTAEHQHAIVQKWSERLYENRENEIIYQECLHLLQKLDDGLHTEYFASHLAGVLSTGACDVIARSMANRLSTLLEQAMQVPYHDIAETSETIVQAFSEAFADRQMLAILGTTSAWYKSYGNIIASVQKEVQKDVQKDTNVAITTEQLLRYNAVKRIANDIIPEDERFKLPNDFFLEEVVKSIVSYLKDAENEQAKETGSSCEKNCVQEFLKAEDLKEQCKIICEVLSDYKKRWYSEQPPK